MILNVIYNCQRPIELSNTVSQQPQLFVSKSDIYLR